MQVPTTRECEEGADRLSMRRARDWKQALAGRGSRAPCIITTVGISDGRSMDVVDSRCSSGRLGFASSWYAVTMYLFHNLDAAVENMPCE